MKNSPDSAAPSGSGGEQLSEAAAHTVPALNGPAAPAETSASASDWHTLLDHALAARQHAYAPYSKYAVGAAVLTETGKIVTGCNVENISFGLTLCAERNAVAAAIAAGCRRILAVAVVAETPPFPCGACRQVLAEFADPAAPPTVIIGTPADGPIAIRSLTQLLPESFTSDALEH